MIREHLDEWVVLDIETVASPDVADLLDPVKAPANYKDPAKIAAYCEEKRLEQIARAGLEADLCEIVAIGFQINHQPVSAWTRHILSEEALVRCVCENIGNRQIVGFALLAFDLPILIRRSQLLGIPVPEISLDRYRTPHLDVLERLTFNGRLTMRSLAFYCRRFGIPSTNGTTGADIAGLVAANDWAAVEAHVRADVEKTAALAHRLGWC